MVDLTRRLTFSKPVLSDDGHGGTSTGYAEQFSVWASVRYLRGGEEVMAARLSGRRPAIVTLRRSNLSEQISHDWKVSFDGQDYALRETPKISDDRQFFELLVEGGVAP